MSKKAKLPKLPILLNRDDKESTGIAPEVSPEAGLNSLKQAVRNGLFSDIRNNDSSKETK